MYGKIKRTSAKELQTIEENGIFKRRELLLLLKVLKSQFRREKQC